MNPVVIRTVILLLTFGAWPMALAAAEETKSVAWLSNLNDGYRRALSERKPLLIRVGAKSCAACRKMERDMQSTEVQAELAHWTPVYLDTEMSSDEIEELGVLFVPALRLRAPDGHQFAEHDGYLAPDAFVAWLKESLKTAAAKADDVLLGSGEPNAMAIVRLTRLLRQRNPVLREAAIRRLSDYPDVARPAVIKAFREGNLGAQLAALEVLEQWHAPMEEIDPWRPETFTDERIARLEQWREHIDVARPSPPKELAEEQLADARRQIDRMLRADQAEAEAIRQRLARLGPALLPEVYARLKDSPPDQDRRRLLTLRYRLTAPDSLIFRWPGGLDRLADSDPRQRRQAADELAKMAGGEDQPLLLELFADPDPLVREISLRGLQHIGGQEANATLVKLLSDPEPNVRAAVLKQLEEAPDAALVPAIVKYLNDEKDADLVVHGIRFLQATKGREATRCLMSLLKHESWQVRAEAAAGIGKLDEDEMTHFSYSSSSSGSDDKMDAATQLKVDAYVALLDLLDDPDPFVVAKAVEGLAGADLAVAVEPLLSAAEKYPDLAASVLTMVAEKDNMRAKAIPHLLKFCKHENSQVRAAAIAALCVSKADDVSEELLAALDDPRTEVRVAGATALFKLLDKRREEAKQKNASGEAVITQFGVTGASSIHVSNLASGAAQLLGSLFKRPAKAKSESAESAGADLSSAEKQADKEEPQKDETQPDQAEQAEPTDSEKGGEVAKQADDAAPKTGQTALKAEPDHEKLGMDSWIEECYAGRRRPKWTSDMAAPLEKMLQADSPEERIMAALALTPLGKVDAALPVLIETTRKNPELLEMSHAVLPWLVWQQRLATFQELSSIASSKEMRLRLLHVFEESPDRRAADLLWEQLADADVAAEEASVLQRALMITYLGNHYYSSSQVSKADRRDLAEAARLRIASGNDWQRMVALTLLATADLDDAAEAAVALANDEHVGAKQRTNAFQVQLLAQSKKDAMSAALTSLKGTDADRKKIALKFLVHGPDELRSLEHGIFLSVDLQSSSVVSHTSGTPIVPKPPDGVTIEDVRPLLSDPEPEIAANAGYLSVLLGDPEGMAPLLRYWRQQKTTYNDWKKLAYQAIAVADDPQYIPVLREIYSKLQEYEISEFYWTIRIMSGPEILKFRKQIRDEVGPSKLQ